MPNLMKLRELRADIEATQDHLNDLRQARGHALRQARAEGVTVAAMMEAANISRVTAYRALGATEGEHGSRN